MEKHEYIRLKRKDMGIKQYELAKLIGITVSEMSKIEKGNRKISMDLFAKLNKVLKFSEDEIKNVLKLDSEGLLIYNSYTINLDKIFTYEETGLLESLSKEDLIKIKNYLYFLTNNKVKEEEKESFNTLIKSLNKNN